MVWLDKASFGEDHRALNDILQFSYIAGIMMSQKQAFGLRRQAQMPFVVSLAKGLEKMLGQQGNITFTATQGRKLNLDHVQAIIDIFAKRARFNERLQIFVGGSHHAHVAVTDFRAADRAVFAGLQNPQQFHLQRLGHLADFVEKNRAAAGGLKPADFVPDRAGKRAPDVAKQLGFQQILRQCATVDRHERLVLAPAVAMQRACHELFAGAAFTLDQNRRVRVGDLHDELQNPDDLGIMPDDEIELMLAAKLSFDLAQRDILRALPLQGAIRCRRDEIGNALGGFAARSNTATAFQYTPPLMLVLQLHF